MKKAQWKADPRTRAFGVDPRELRVRELEGELQALKENNELWRYKAQHYQNEQSKLAEQVGQIYQYRAAYKWLALTGVVLEHEGEFKHLKGTDMDEFFGLHKINPPPPTPLRGTSERYTQALANSMQQTKEAVLTGTSFYKMWADELTKAENGSNS
jgi:hypothetical protein